MASAINSDMPITGSPTTQSVRDQFATAKSEISALQLATTTTAAITGGTVNGAAIGGSDPEAGAFTTLSATGTVTGPSGTWASTGINLATTDSYFIDSNNVLSQTTLGSTVLTSSLTSVGTLTSLTVGGEIVEAVYAIPSSTTPSIDPANGTIQTWTLTGASTPTEVLATGESVKLTIAADTNSYGVTWSMVDEWIDGIVPSTLSTTETSHIELWQEGSTVYGSFIGVSS